jgi:hypothetical protein
MKKFKVYVAFAWNRVEFTVKAKSQDEADFLVFDQIFDIIPKLRRFGGDFDVYGEAWKKYYTRRLRLKDDETENTERK